ncbi:hypothetical protein [Sigmofec virus UA08Rod_6800]|uniref:Uncharacterized protein n=1 Tax=Sigmofec virus UA08Rod_6800 TaxID=2929240 RepID=A0A976R6T2_9VIRU|nr:hypothetical protein [Sigmofec virus UA08Rod_6800]
MKKKTWVLSIIILVLEKVIHPILLKYQQEIAEEMIKEREKLETPLQ